MMNKEMANKIVLKLAQKPFFNDVIWHCDVCNEDIKRSSKYNHVRSKIHLYLEQGIDLRSTHWHCKACNCILKNKSKTRHLDSIKHWDTVYEPVVDKRPIDEVRRSVFTKVPPQSYLWSCDLCSYSFVKSCKKTTYKSIKNHMRDHTRSRIAEVDRRAS